MRSSHPHHMPVIADSRRRLALVTILAVAADAASKLAVTRWLNDPIEFGVLQLRVTENTGIAFGLGADQSPAIVIAVTGLAVVALAIAAWGGHLGSPIPAGLILGGGLANIGDRILGGSVTDMFDVGRWPVFNVADIFLTIGIGLLLLAAATDSGPERPETDRLAEDAIRPESSSQ